MLVFFQDKYLWNKFVPLKFDDGICGVWLSDLLSVEQVLFL